MSLGLRKKIQTNDPFKSDFRFPNGWKLETLGNLVEIRSGDSPSGFKFIDQGAPFFKVDNMNYADKYLVDSDLHFSEHKKELMPAGMVVFPKRGASIFTGKVRILKSPSYFDTNVMGLIANDRMDSEFLYYFIGFVGLGKLADTTSIPQINNKHIIPIRIALPPLGEQKKIAGILSAVDAAIEKTGEIISATEKLKKGLMQDFFREDKYPKKRIADVAEVLTGGTPKTSVQEYWGGSIKWMSSGEVNLRRVRDTEKTITQKGLENSNARLLPIGSVMVALAGQGKTRGKVALLEIETTCNQSLAAIVPKQALLVSDFLFYNLEYRYQELRKISGGEGRAGLNLRLIQEFTVPIPSLQEQREIVSVLESVDNKISLNKNIKARLASLKTGLMHELLTGGKRTV